MTKVYDDHPSKRQDVNLSQSGGINNQLTDRSAFLDIFHKLFHWQSMTMMRNKQGCTASWFTVFGADVLSKSLLLCFSPNKATQCSQQQPLVVQNYISKPLRQIRPVFTISRVMYETETTSQQPINQLQTNDGHSGPKPYWLMTDAMWSGCSSREHNNVVIAAVL